jgi:hypothetical protein
MVARVLVTAGVLGALLLARQVLDGGMKLPPPKSTQTQPDRSAEITSQVSYVASPALDENEDDGEESAESETGSVAGRVEFAGGRRAPGAEVEAIGTDAIAVTGTDGAFFLEVESGEQRLRAQLGQDVGAMPSSVTVVAGKLVQGIVIRLVPGSSFEGRVTAAGDAPIAVATVLAQMTVGKYGAPSGRREKTTATTKTDASGHFSVGPLPPGVYTVNASAPGFTDEDYEQLALEAGQHLPVSFRLTRTGAVEGTVRDTAGHRVADALVHSWDWHGQAVETRSADDGSFRLDGLRPVRISVEASHRDAAGHVGTGLDVPSGAVAHVDFVLPLPGVLAGSVAMPSGAAAPGAQLRLWCNARADSIELTTDNAGRFHTKLLPGRYQVTATRGTASINGNALVQAGESSQLDRAGRACSASGFASRRHRRRGER